MSGIAAVIDTRASGVDADHLRRWARALERIGNDGLNTWAERSVGLAYAASAMESADAFPQPASLDGQVWITADARIDAVAELVHALRGAGRKPRADAPAAELILHAYHVWGDDCLDWLLGDFAFVIWDARRERLLAATDHFRVRTLYYARTQYGITISNWAPAVWAHPDVDRALDDQAIVRFLTTGAVTGDETAFASLRRLPHARALTWEGGRTVIRRYWQPPVEEPLLYRDPRDYPSHLVQVLTQAISDRVRGRSAGVLMSGGVDSPAVAALAARSGLDVRAHVAVYDVLLPDRERVFASAVGARLGIPVQFHAADAETPFAYARANFDGDPVPSNAPFRGITADLLSGLAKHCGPVLTGHGTDALLRFEPIITLGRHEGGMRPWSLIRAAASHLRRYHRRPPLGMRMALRSARRSAQMDSATPPWLPAVYAKLSVGPELSAASHPFRPEAYRVTSGEWIPNAVSADTTFGRHIGTLVTHPFMDQRVVRFCLRLPPVPWCWDKHVLREAMRDHLPAEVVKRRKTTLAGDQLSAAVRRYGWDWMAGLSPSKELAPFYAWPTFDALQPLTRHDASWQNTRPIALDVFLRKWNAVEQVVQR